MKKFLKSIISDSRFEPFARSVWGHVRPFLGNTKPIKFTSSDKYWEERYRRGWTSGAGSYGRLAMFKAQVLNRFVETNGIRSVIEFGSGDGNQLVLSNYPSYLGIDVSSTAILACRKSFAKDSTKTFLTLEEYRAQRADLAVSLDVIYHLVEDHIYAAYMSSLFDAAERFVIIYASNTNDHSDASHVRHRRFTDWVEENRPGFRLKNHIPNSFPFDAKDPDNTSFADFYIFEAMKM